MTARPYLKSSHGFQVLRSHFTCMWQCVTATAFLGDKCQNVCDIEMNVMDESDFVRYQRSMWCGEISYRAMQLWLLKVCMGSANINRATREYRTAHGVVLWCTYKTDWCSKWNSRSEQSTKIIHDIDIYHVLLGNCKFDNNQSLSKVHSMASH